MNSNYYEIMGFEPWKPRENLIISEMVNAVGNESGIDLTKLPGVGIEVRNIIKRMMQKPRPV